MTPEYRKQLQVLTERALAESLARSRLQDEANAARAAARFMPWALGKLGAG